jgi:hypothetical protein
MSNYRVFYKFRDKDSSYILEAENAVAAIEVHRATNPRANPAFKAERVYSFKHVQEELQFTLTPAVVSFLKELVGSASLYIESPEKMSEEVEGKYFELTQHALEPARGVYNIAPDSKWGIEGSIRFDSSIQIPDDLGVTAEKPGQINNIALFWVLVRLGFRLDGKHIFDAQVAEVA